MQQLTELINYLSTLSFAELLTAAKSLLGAFAFDLIFGLFR